MIDTIDTCEFKMARNLVSIPLPTIDTIDTRDRHLGPADRGKELPYRIGEAPASGSLPLTRC